MAARIHELVRYLPVGVRGDFFRAFALRVCTIKGDDWMTGVGGASYPCRCGVQNIHRWPREPLAVVSLDGPALSRESPCLGLAGHLAWAG